MSRVCGFVCGGSCPYLLRSFMAVAARRLLDSAVSSSCNARQKFVEVVENECRYGDLLHMRGVADPDFRCSLRNCSSSNTGPRADSLLPPPLQQISDVVAVNLNVGAKKLRWLQSAGGGNAAAALKRGEGGSAGTRRNPRERLHVMGDAVVG